MYRPAWILGLHCLIVLPLALIATSFAHATCGDWLQHQDLELNSLSDFRASAHRTPTWIAAAEVTGRILFPPVAGNYHGQKCRQAPHPSNPPLPAPRPPRSETVVLAAVGDTWSAATGQFDVDRGFRVHPAKGFFPGLEHPPRV